MRNASCVFDSHSGKGSRDSCRRGEIQIATWHVIFVMGLECENLPFCFSLGRITENKIGLKMNLLIENRK